MRYLSFTIIFTISLCFDSFAQNKDVWVGFWNKDSTLIGFKNKAGQIKITPKFNSFTSARKFEDIIGVSEEKAGRTDYYYLTKRGRIVGRNNLYTFDNGADCESEGFIRFRDKVTHKVGMFDKMGNIAIPADYDNLMPVKNGMIAALKGGHWDIREQSEHNQFPWVGSKEILIDIHNNVLVENFRFDEDINFFSSIVSEQPSKSPVRQNYKGINGKYYSFINFDKEFRVWLKNSLLNDLTKANLLKISYKDIYFWNELKKWLGEAKTPFINKNFELIRSKLLELNAVKCDYDVFTEGLNPYIYYTQEFEKYFNNCGTSKDWIYPMKTIVISHKVKADILQDHFSFLRTDIGYKLIEISIKSGGIY